MDYVPLRRYQIKLSRNSKIDFSFVSKRLAKLMLKKSLSGSWRYTYFPLQADMLSFGTDFSGKLISNKGLVLFTLI